MPDLTSVQAWIAILMGLLLPFIVKAIKWASGQDLSGKLAFGITIAASVGLSVGARYLAEFFKAPPAWFASDLTEIFMLSQIVYQLLKEKLDL